MDGGKRHSTLPLVDELRTLRLAQKLNQYELSRSLGFTRSYLCRLERGAHQPTLFTLMCWAQALGCELRLSHITDTTDLAGGCK